MSLINVDNQPFPILESDSTLQKGKKNACKPKGETKGKDKTLEYRDGDRWVPAVYHDSVRHYLIREARKHGKYGELFISSYFKFTHGN